MKNPKLCPKCHKPFWEERPDVCQHCGYQKKRVYANTAACNTAPSTKSTWRSRSAASTGKGTGRIEIDVLKFMEEAIERIKKERGGAKKHKPEGE